MSETETEVEERRQEFDEIQELIKGLNPEMLFSPEWCNRIFHAIEPTDSERLTTPDINMFKIENFLDAEECQEIISTYKDKTEPSTTTGDVEDYRTSRTCMINSFNDHELIKKSIKLDIKISNVLNIHPAMSEGIEFEYFKSGEFFKRHVDFFSVDSSGETSVELLTKGQRTWTAVLYLNEPVKGGETEFPELKLKISPKTGLLVCWNNISEKGEISSKFIHEELMVAKGSKAILTKYYRDKRIQ
jgi:prolyl 4-hydroxylase